MNGAALRKIKKIIKDYKLTPAQFRRIKKLYDDVPADKKEDFLEALKLYRHSVVD